MKTPQQTQCEKCKQQNAIAYCRDCGKFICETCKLIHATWEELSSHEVISLDQLKGNVTKLVPPKKTVSYCPKHKGKELELYCETCGELICHNCTVRLHQGHRYDLVADTFQKHKEELVAFLKPVEQHLGTVEKALVGLDGRCQQISEQRNAMEATIHKTIRQLQESLEVRKTELISQLDRLTQQKLKRLAAQRDQFELIQTRLSSCLEFVNESLRTGSEGEVLGMKKPVVKQIEEVTAEFQPKVLAPKEQADLKFSTSTEFHAACKQFGEVRACPVSPTIKQLGTPIRTIGGLNSPWGVAVNESGEIIVVEFGGHCVSILSPQGEKIRTFGTEGSAPGQFTSPSCVALDRDGNILVSDCGNHRVQKFSPGGKFIKSVGTKGNGPLQFTYPNGITVSQDGRIYVCDRLNNRVQVLNPDLTYHSSIYSQGGESGKLRLPGDTAFNSRGNVYTTDRDNHCIQVFTGDGQFLRRFGKKGSGDGELSDPVGITIDSDDMVYVADSDNHRVSVFTSQGQLVRTFGAQGTGPGRFNYTFGITVDRHGSLYVTDKNNNRLQIF